MILIKGIIFDLGGTLLHFDGNLAKTEAQGATAVSDWFIKKKRIKLDGPALSEAILACRREGLAQAKKTHKEFLMHEGIKQAIQHIDGPKRAEALCVDAVRPFFEAEEDAHRLVPQAVDTLKVLYAHGFKLGLLSNATDDYLIQRLVNRNGLRPWLSPVFSSAGLGWRKPLADPFLLIAKRWGFAPKEVVMVGDTLATDVLGAYKADMHSVLVTWVQNKDNLANSHIKPNLTISRLSELPGLINTL